MGFSNARCTSLISIVKVEAVKARCLCDWVKGVCRVYIADIDPGYKDISIVPCPSSRHLCCAGTDHAVAEDAPPAHLVHMHTRCRFWAVHAAVDVRCSSSGWTSLGIMADGWSHLWTIVNGCLWGRGTL